MRTIFGTDQVDITAQNNKMSSIITTATTDATVPVPLVDMQADRAANETAISDAIHRVLAHGRFIMGPEVPQLEEKLSTYLTADKSTPVHCRGVSDGTAALQLCLMALNIAPGDEVITTPFTWISTCEVISLVGATPVFCDIDPQSYLLNHGKVAKLITPRTRAIITVSLFGRVPDMAELRSILDQHTAMDVPDTQSSGTSRRIAIIEDGAQSFGAVDKDGHLSCSSPSIDFGTTSFFPTKPLGCYGDGGAVFTRNKDLDNAINSLRLHGKTGKGIHGKIGLNSRLDTLQAAILCAKWPAFPSALQARRKAAQTYIQLFSSADPGLQRVILPTTDSDAQGEAPDGKDVHDLSAWGVFTIRIDKRDDVVKHLKTVDVGCAVYYATPCHLQPAFQPKAGDYPDSGEVSLSLQNAELMAKSVLSLPIHPYITKDVQARVVREVMTALDDLGVSSKPA